jgi:putative membrane protein
MSPKAKKFIQSWVINTLAVLVAVEILGDSRIHYGSWVDLLVASLLLGILNAFLRPIIMLLALPLLIFTLGLFMLVINALILYFVGSLFDGFHVNGFWPAFWGALIIGVISLFLNVMTGAGSTRVEFRRGPRPPPGSDRGGGGPVIDV